MPLPTHNLNSKTGTLQSLRLRPRGSPPGYRIPSRSLLATLGSGLHGTNAQSWLLRFPGPGSRDRGFNPFVRADRTHLYQHVQRIFIQSEMLARLHDGTIRSSLLELEYPASVTQ